MYRHSVPHTVNPFTSQPGKRVNNKIKYCARHIGVMAKWYAETGNKLFKREAELWQEKIKLVNADRL
jgi:hypothetical protein